MKIPNHKWEVWIYCPYWDYPWKSTTTFNTYKKAGILVIKLKEMIKNSMFKGYWQDCKIIHR